MFLIIIVIFNGNFNNNIKFQITYKCNITIYVNTIVHRFIKPQKLNGNIKYVFHNGSETVLYKTNKCVPIAFCQTQQ